MPQVLPPQPERFDPITARWLTPGGPLPDPARDRVDPDRREPVELVGPIPPELGGVELSAQADVGVRRPSPSATLRRLVLIVLMLAAVATVGVVMTSWAGS